MKDATRHSLVKQTPCPQGRLWATRVFYPPVLLCMAIACSLASTSCSQLNVDQKTAQAQAEERWSNVRAKLKLQLASEAFSRGECDEAQKQLDETLKLDASLPDAYLLQARIFLERGEIAAAQEALTTAIDRGAASPETDYLAGVIAQRYGRFEDALRAYRRASERDTHNAHYVAAVAETLVTLESPAEALALIESRWTDFEHNATLRATAGQIHMLMGRYEQAADVYRDAVRISPNDQTLQCQFGLALSLADEHAEAISVLEPLTQKDKEVPGYVLVALGRAYLGAGQYENAKTILRRATAASPASLPAWSWLARAALLGDDLVTARQAAAKAADLGSTTPEPFILLGYICLRQGHTAPAIRALETALAKQPNDPLALYLLAQVRRKAPGRDAGDMSTLGARNTDAGRDRPDLSASEGSPKPVRLPAEISRAPAAARISRPAEVNSP